MASAKEHFPWPASPPPSIFSFSLPRHVHRTPPRGQRERTTNARHAGEGKHLQVNASAAATPTPHRPVRFSTWEIKVLFGNEKRLEQYYAVLSASRSSLGESCVAGLLWSIGWSHCISIPVRTWSVVLVHQSVHNNNTDSLSVGCSGVAMRSFRVRRRHRCYGRRQQWTGRPRS